MILICSSLFSFLAFIYVPTISFNQPLKIIYDIGIRTHEHFYVDTYCFTALLCILIYVMFI